MRVEHNVHHVVEVTIQRPLEKNQTWRQLVIRTQDGGEIEITMHSDHDMPQVTIE